MPEDRTSAKVLPQDAVTEPGGRAKPGRALREGWADETFEPMLAGRTSRRVAVIDIDPDTGQVLPGAPVVPPKRNPKTGEITVRTGKHLVKDPNDPSQNDFKQVSVLNAVMKTMAMFEEPDVLGRPLDWAFADAQLLVVPRAGNMANAFYHRDSRSLQFFFCDAEKDGVAQTSHTCLSPDIVLHETTQAILDGTAPDLSGATWPRSLALHEAMADLGAVIFPLRTRRLLLQVLKDTGGDIRKAKAFNQIARQFGQATSGTGRPLRDLFSDASSNPDDHNERDFVKAEFARRGIVADPAERGPVVPAIALPADLDLSLLVQSEPPRVYRRVVCSTTRVRTYNFA